MQSVQGRQHPLVANELEQLGGNLFRQKQWKDAESTLRECLTMREKLHAGDWATFRTASLLGTTLLAQLNAKDAEPYLIKAYEGMKASEARRTSENQAALAQTLDYLILASKSLQKTEEFNKWTAEKEKLSSQANTSTKK